MIDLKDKIVYITGINSMVGKAVYKALKCRGAIPVGLSHFECDLLVYEEFIKALELTRPDYVIHCAGFNGGISFNKQFPADIYFRTAQMALNVLRGCQENLVEKVVSVLPSCAYAAFKKNGEPKELLNENEFLDGCPHDSVECHGFAKRILFEYSKQIYKQFGLTYPCVIINNSFGINDSFDVNKTKVVGALIKKFVTAQRDNLPYVELFGTGIARREFVYCDDAGEGIVRTLERYDNPLIPLNIGHGMDVPIALLAILIREFVGYRGEIKYLGGGDGQLKKLLDNTRMKEVLQWSPPTQLTDGLQQTIQWYKENYN
jgi:GDP-L-fucose synthase